MDIEVAKLSMQILRFPFFNHSTYKSQKKEKKNNTIKSSFGEFAQKVIVTLPKQRQTS